MLLPKKRPSAVASRLGPPRLDSPWVSFALGRVMSSVAQPVRGLLDRVLSEKRLPSFQREQGKKVQAWSAYVKVSHCWVATGGGTMSGTFRGKKTK